MPNMRDIIKQNNARILNNTPRDTPKQCSCENRADCPLDNNCCVSCIVYSATVKSNGKENIYYGLTEGEFKIRYNKHMSSFRLRTYEHDTKLSSFIWTLQDKGTPYTIKWDIVTRASPYKCGTRRCGLCLTEKTIIARSKHKGMLNLRTELISKCRHRNKFSLSSVK